eukprot:9090820-Alexandrium_andersonii.AAC.1
MQLGTWQHDADRRRGCERDQVRGQGQDQAGEERVRALEAAVPSCWPRAGTCNNAPSMSLP